LITVNKYNAWVNTRHKMDTGFWIKNSRIWGPKSPGEYRIESGFIRGPNNNGRFRIKSGRIYGPEEPKSKFWINGNHIYGPNKKVPWLQ